jgi:protein O-mannosyl-transferase
MATNKTNKNTRQGAAQTVVSHAASEKKSLLSSGRNLLFVLCLVSLIAYANTLSNGFVLDDHDVIIENTIVTKGIKAIPEIFSTTYRQGFTKIPNDYYRPLSLATFAVQYEFSDTHPFAYHLVNVLLFAGCVLLLFLFLDQFFHHRRTIVAFIACLLFALHPIHTEVVANIKSRDELLCFFFAFASLVVFFKYLATGKASWLLAGSFCFFLSLISKETTITFIALVPLILYFYQDKLTNRSALIIAGVVITAIIFLAIRFSLLHHYGGGAVGGSEFLENPLVQKDLSPESSIATIILICGYYLKFLFFPYPLVSDYSFNSIPLTHFSNPLVIISLVAYAILFYFIIIRFSKNKKDPYAFAMVFFLITISLFTNILFLLAVGERYTFLASVAFCLVLALLIEQYGNAGTEDVFAFIKKSKVLVIIVPIAAIYLFTTARRNAEWVDNYTLCRADIAASPNNARLRYFAGYELINAVLPAEQDPEKQREIRQQAIDYFRQAVNIYDKLADAYANIGFVYFNTGLYDSAELYDRHALALKPDFRNVETNLSKLYFVTKRYRQAIDICKKEMIEDPNDVEAYTNISACFGTMGSYDSAIYYAKKGIAVNADFNQLYENIAFTYKLMNKWDSAKKYEAIAQTKNPAFRLQ